MEALREASVQKAGKLAEMRALRGLPAPTKKSGRDAAG
jgi:hypothetical protein